MVRLLLATRNAHKTREFAEILGKNFEVTDLSSARGAAEIKETGGSFEENAILKALAVSPLRSAPGGSRAKDRPAFAGLRRGRHLLVIADDSGLEVDALNDAPGIYSARYAGENASDEANVDKLLGELSRQNLPASKHTARFRCVIALARAGKLLGTFEGVVEGAIVDLARGRNGFGYDPIFVPKGFDRTFAELPAEIKNKISHRAKAITRLREALRSDRSYAEGTD
jgi:XTP/dITP diphosphohydrolase